MNGRLITPSPPPKPLYASLLERQLQEIHRAATTILMTPRSRWPQGWDWDLGRAVARQSLNRIGVLQAQKESGEVEQVAFEAFCLGRIYELWKKYLPG